MNIDRNKIIKMGCTLALVFLAVAVMRKVVDYNSITLADYAALNAPSPGAEATDASLDTQPADAVSSGEETAGAPEGMSGEGQTTPGTNGNGQGPDSMESTSSSATASGLVGATLNGEALLEQRVTYAESFYYEPLSDNLRRYITGVSYPDPSNSGNTLMITYDELSYLHLLHYDFDGNLAEGELICNSLIANDLIEIFYELYRNEYRLEKVRLIDEYDGDDIAAMEDNNTSCFNYRVVAGSTSLSRHALGLAIDINPLYNPYISWDENGREQVSPEIAGAYADRSGSFPYKIDENDLCYRLFIDHGFTWGGDWNSAKDYQHFQKIPDQYR